MAQIDPHIHRRLLKRLLATYCLVSLALGTVVYFYEMEMVDDFVVKFATEESQTFESLERDYLNSGDLADRDYLFRKCTEQIEKSHFITVELYDRARRQIVEVTKAGEADEHFGAHPRHLFPDKETAAYRKRSKGGTIYLQILVPLKGDGEEIVGYFEGEYRVDATTMQLIRKRVGSALALVLLVTLTTTVTLYPTIIGLNKDLIQFSVDLSEANIGMLEVLGNAISKRDSGTNLHNYRVTLFSIRQAEALGLDRVAMQGLIKGSFLHDVGKIGISDTILLKPDSLTDEEFQLMKTHVTLGVEIIRGYQWLQDAIDVVRCHQERFDGSGYRDGMKGETIPLSARIFAISDVFDALTSKRPYKEPFSFQESLDYIVTNKGILFDPRLVDNFQKLARQLYDDFSGAEEAVLKETLKKSIATYF